MSRTNATGCDFDSVGSDAGFPGYSPSSGLVEGIIGVNVPLGRTLFVGAEGFGARAIKGPENWNTGPPGSARPCATAA